MKSQNRITVVQTGVQPTRVMLWVPDEQKAGMSQGYELPGVERVEWAGGDSVTVTLRRAEIEVRWP
jgi:hypothetical protein